MEDISIATTKTTKTTTTIARCSSKTKQKRKQDQIQHIITTDTEKFVKDVITKLTRHSQFLHHNERNYHDIRDDENNINTTNNNNISLSIKSNNYNNNNNTNNAIPILNRNEIIVGDIIGKGSFSEVRQIISFQQQQQQQLQFHNNHELIIHHDEEYYNTRDDDDDSIIQKPQVDNNTYGNHCYNNYVIKHLRKDLTSSTNNTNTNNPKKFLHAAIQLQLEAKFLTKINHKNIIKLRGWSGLDNTTFNIQKYDNFFLIFHRLDETLKQRIIRWKKEQQQQQDDDESNNNNNKSSLSSSSSSSSYYCYGQQQQQQQQYWKKQHDHYHYHQNNNNNNSYNNNDNNNPIVKEILFLREKLNYALQIASAIDYLHDHHIIYRDLKPDNIGFINGNTIQLFDFGMIRELPSSSSSSQQQQNNNHNHNNKPKKGNNNSTSNCSSYNNNINNNNNNDQTYHMSCVGTIRYMAPEVLLGQPYNLKVDVYSFTMVLFSILFLEKPFYGYNKHSIKDLVCYKHYRPKINNKNYFSSNTNTNNNNNNSNNNNSNNNNNNSNNNNTNTNTNNNNSNNNNTNTTTICPKIIKKIHNLCHIGWKTNYKKRPTMKQIYNELHYLLYLIETKLDILLRSNILQSFLNEMDAFSLL